MIDWICARCLTRLRGEVAGICPSCGGADVVPIDTPRGGQLAAAIAPAAAAPARGVPQSAIAATVFSALAAIGAFLPWANAGFRSLSGIEGDGKIVVAAMVLAFFIGVAGISRRQMSRAGGFGILLCGVVGLAIAIVDGGNIAEMAEGNAFVSVGSGLYLLGIASFFLSFVGLHALIAGPKAG
jgi:hypothetical protein